MNLTLQILFSKRKRKDFVRNILIALSLALGVSVPVAEIFGA